MGWCCCLCVCFSLVGWCGCGAPSCACVRSFMVSSFVRRPCCVWTLEADFEFVAFHRTSFKWLERKFCRECDEHARSKGFGFRSLLSFVFCDNESRWQMRTIGVWWVLAAREGRYCPSALEARRNVVPIRIVFKSCILFLRGWGHDVQGMCVMVPAVFYFIGRMRFAARSRMVCIHR